MIIFDFSDEIWCLILKIRQKCEMQKKCKIDFRGQERYIPINFPRLFNVSDWSVSPVSSSLKTFVIKRLLRRLVRLWLSLLNFNDAISNDQRNG